MTMLTSQLHNERLSHLTWCILCSRTKHHNSRTFPNEQHLHLLCEWVCVCVCVCMCVCVKPHAWEPQYVATAESLPESDISMSGAAPFLAPLSSAGAIPALCLGLSCITSAWHKHSTSIPSCVMRARAWQSSPSPPYTYRNALDHAVQMAEYQQGLQHGCW